MSTLLVYLTMIAAINPLRLRGSLPGGQKQAAPAPLLLGAAITLVAAGVLALAADSLLDAFDVTAETFRIAAGMVATLVGFRVLVSPGRPDEPELDGIGAAVVPIAFPLLFTPQLAMLAISFGATESTGAALGALVVAFGLAIGFGFLAHNRPTVWLAGARLLAAALVLGGVALIVAGIRDV